MTNIAMDLTTGESLLSAGDQLIEAIEAALSTSRINGVPVAWKAARNSYMGDADVYPERAFGVTAIGNLRTYRTKVVDALVDLGHGDWRPLWHCSTLYTGLSKQMDFDFDWMVPRDKERVREALYHVVHVASSISERGYNLQNL